MERPAPRYSPRHFRRWRAADRPRPGSRSLTWRHLLWQVIGWILTIHFVGKWVVGYLRG